MLIEDKTLLNYADGIVKAIAAGNGENAGNIICEMLDHVTDYYGPKVANAMRNSFLEAIETEDPDQFFFLISAVVTYAYLAVRPEIFIQLNPRACFKLGEPGSA